VKYVIWSTVLKPWYGNPIDRPGTCVGVSLRSDYDTRTGMSYLEDEPTFIVKEFEALDNKEAEGVFDTWWDIDRYKEREHDE
jgi:hypothetical protein